MMNKMQVEKCRTIFPNLYPPYNGKPIATSPPNPPPLIRYPQKASKLLHIRAHQFFNFFHGLNVC
ncbi:hypothetical protein B0O99DRAFT_613042 [Bisporella sp. PMI_857]|nr:hypothetical protein B0O99DRAFT_613042 [Bisporella sp. PMI_857]